MGERWQRVRSIFERAVELEGASRESWLVEACGEDSGLLEEVRGLLRVDDGADSFLDADARVALGAGPARGFGPSLAGSTTADSRPGQPGPSASSTESIGPYRLLEKLGAGGMGEVWLAEQGQPVRRRVALKIIKPGMDSASVLARFDAERQALARMDHPAIARVYDAGTTPRGRPYFVMEHVRGLPITTHCDRERLTTRQRLDLMLQVCEGVQHAHQRGIIHRDLKPSNVLVTTEGERSAPKIIDFGVAKATEGRLTDRTLHTVLGELIGTPEYMSPEQADLFSQDIDVRTDVYALGVILYELLTGTLPFESKDLRRQSFDEIRRRIREVDPPTPSTRFGTLGGDLTTSTARARRTDPVRLRKELKGDLDWIVMRALAKERDRRYGSPAELAADIRRHLENEPVLAGPPGARYRAGKFVRRHRVAVGFVAVLAVSLLAFAVTMALQTRRVARESARAATQAYRFNLIVVGNEIEAGQLIAAGEFLDAAPEAMRGWEWRYLRARLDPTVRRFDEPRAAATGIAVAADGRSFVTAGSDNTLLHRDLATGGVIRSIPTPGAPLRWVMSGDGRELHAIGEGADDQTWLASWNLTDGSRLRYSTRDESFFGAAYRSSFAVDRRRLAILAADFRRLEVIDLDHPEKRVVRTLDEPHRGPALGPAGDRIVVAGDPFMGSEQVLILDAVTLETLGRLEGTHDAITGMAFSPDESRVATITMDGRIQLWDLAAAAAGGVVGRSLVDIDGQQGELRGVRYSADGTRLLTFGKDQMIRVRDAATGATLRVLPSQPGGIVAFDLVRGTDEVVSLRTTGSVEVWSTGEPSPIVLAGHQSFVYAVDIDPDLGLLLSGGWDGFVGRPGCVRLWDLETGDPIAAWGDVGTRAYNATFVPGERAILAALTGPPFPGHPSPTDLERVDLDTGSVAWGGEASGQLTDLRPSHRSPVAWTMTSDSVVERVDTENGTATVLRSFPIEDGGGVAWENRIAVTGDERTMAIAFGRGHLELMDAGDLARIHELPLQDSPVHALAFDSAGRRLLSASADGTVSVWDVRSGRQIGRLVGHELGVLCARFDPSGSRIATGGRDGTLRIWNGETYEPLIALSGHASYVHALAWTEDGESIITASGDHTLRIWETRPIRERYRAQRERREIVERLTPRIDAWAASAPDPAPVGFLDAAPDLTDRERQVARQILLGRALGQAPPR